MTVFQGVKAVDADPCDLGYLRYSVQDDGNPYSVRPSCVYSQLHLPCDIYIYICIYIHTLHVCGEESWWFSGKFGALSTEG